LNSSLLRQYYRQRSGAWRGCELRNRLFSTKIIFLAERTRELTTKFAILPNGCYQPLF